MKQTFAASLCKGGILGGWLILDDTAVTYRTGKLTVSPQLRDLQLPLSSIQAVRPSRFVLFPAVVIEMKDGRDWTFIIFGRRRFLKALAQLGKF